MPHLAKGIIETEGLEPIETGAKALDILVNRESVYIRRMNGAVRRLEALSDWLKPVRSNQPLLAGTEIEIVQVGKHSSWYRSPRLDSPESLDEFQSRSDWERFLAAWPTILETTRLLEQMSGAIDPVPAELILPPNNRGSLLRECSTRQRQELLRRLGYDIEQLENFPHKAHQGELILHHGDLTERNIVLTPAGEYRPIDWEMTSIHSIVVSLCHPLSTLLLKQADTSLWPVMIGEVLEDMLEISNQGERAFLHSLFWEVVAEAINLSEFDEPDYTDYLLPGLGEIIKLYW